MPRKKEEGRLSVDLYETDDEILILAPVAGSSMEDLSVSVADDVLTIKGTRSLSLAPNFEEISQECFWGDFSRSIILPDSADTSKVEATFKDNVLKITIQKLKYE